MLCAISGVAPEVPVTSRKSGNVFERRLIEAYIKENGTDPVNGEELAVEDLVELKSPNVVQPRPPTFTSIPSLLSAFQNEWDALALETFTLKQQLSQTRQELSTALYHHDAAVRVIARLTKERDEARDALSKLTVSGGAATNGDAMQVDNQALPEAIAEKVAATQQKLSSTRKKRAVPEGWATADTISAFEATTKTKPVVKVGTSLDLQAGDDSLELVGGAEGTTVICRHSEEAPVLQSLECGGKVTHGCWWGSRAVVASSNGAVKVFENDGSELAQIGSHAGAATSVSLHPCGELLASTGMDKSYILYDLTSLKKATQIFTESELTCGQFHPDGHLFAAGGRDGRIQLFETITGENQANFDAGGPLAALSFSENGTWLASVVQGEPSVSIWDLRKMAVTKTLDIGGPVLGLQWDYSGQFLAVTGPGCVAVQHYAKASKAWSEPFRKAVAGAAVQWGSKAASLKVLTPDGALAVLEAR